MNAAIYLAPASFALGWWLRSRRDNAQIKTLTGQLDSSAGRLGDAVKTQQGEQKQYGK